MSGTIKKPNTLAKEGGDKAGGRGGGQGGGKGPGSGKLSGGDATKPADEKGKQGKGKGKCEKGKGKGDDSGSESDGSSRAKVKIPKDQLRGIHYLRGKCAKGADCTFVHLDVPTEGIKGHPIYIDIEKKLGKPTGKLRSGGDGRGSLSPAVATPVPLLSRPQLFPQIAVPRKAGVARRSACAAVPFVTESDMEDNVIVDVECLSEVSLDTSTACPPSVSHNSFAHLAGRCPSLPLCSCILSFVSLHGVHSNLHVHWGATSSRTHFTDGELRKSAKRKSRHKWWIGPDGVTWGG